MTSEQSPTESLPELNRDPDAPQCGKLVAMDGDRELLCDLPAGHPDSTPCSAPVERMQGH